MPVHLQFTFYRDAELQWRWSLLRDAETLAVSGVGYATRGQAIESMAMFDRLHIPVADVEAHGYLKTSGELVSSLPPQRSRRILQDGGAAG